MTDEKLKGPYVPCVTDCGQSEPCFGCDISDYAADPCPICRKAPADTATRKDARGLCWCQACITEHDNIDWGNE